LTDLPAPETPNGRIRLQPLRPPRSSAFFDMKESTMKRQLANSTKRCRAFASS
jgi:hypothetical protein